MTKTPTYKNDKLYLGFALKYRKLSLSKDKELIASGKTLFKNYYNQKQKKLFYTKDIATFDEKMGFAILKRKDGMLISKGENIYIEEIVSLLKKIPSISKISTKTTYDLKYGDKIYVYIKREKPIKASFIINFLQKHLPKYKLPYKIHFLE